MTAIRCHLKCELVQLNPLLRQSGYILSINNYKGATSISPLPTKAINETQSRVPANVAASKVIPERRK